MITDISERKGAEEALRESEQLYRTIVETAPGMLVICDSQGKNIYVSANCIHICGYTREELIGNFVWWVHNDDRPRMESLLKDTLKNHTSGHNVVFKGVKKDGGIWYGSQSWEPILDSRGNLIQFVIQINDITGRSNVEEILKQPEQPHSPGNNNYPNPTLAINPDRKVVAWNKTVDDMTTVKAENTTGKGNYK